MKKQKLVALGVVAVTSLATVLPVHAADFTGGGATTVSYTPGSSTGGNPDGTTADWTVDYPLTIALDDSAVSAATARTANFAVVNTGTDTSYTGTSTISVKMVSHANATGDGQGITLQDASGTTTDKVIMKMLFNDQAVTTNSTTEVGTLSSAETSKTLKAYLSNKTGAKETKKYSTTLTWSFESTTI